MLKKILVSTVIFFLYLTQTSYASNQERFDVNARNDQSRHNNQLLYRAKAFIDLVESLTADNVAKQSPNLTKIPPEDLISQAFIREIRPTTLNQPQINWEQYQIVLSRYSETLFDTFEVVIDRSTVSYNRVVLEAHADANVKESAGGGKYEQQYLLIFEFDRQYKIKRLVEYVDSFYTSCFFNLIDCTNINPTVISAGTIDTSISIESIWGNGYCANVNIKNLTDSPVTDWTVKINLNTASVHNSWSADVSTTTDSMIATKPQWSSALSPGDLSGFGYCAKANTDGLNWKPQITSSEGFSRGNSSANDVRLMQ